MFAIGYKNNATNRTSVFLLGIQQMYDTHDLCNGAAKGSYTSGKVFPTAEAAERTIAELTSPQGWTAISIPTGAIVEGDIFTINMEPTN